MIFRSEGLRERVTRDELRVDLLDPHDSILDEIMSVVVPDIEMASPGRETPRLHDPDCAASQCSQIDLKHGSIA